MRIGAERFGWAQRSAQAGAGAARAAGWIGIGMAAAFRNNQVTKSAARVRLDGRGMVTVETDMTDIGTGSYTIIAQTAAEMMGVPLDRVVVRLGDSDFPVSSGSGGQWGGNSSTAGVYAACVKLREAVAQRAGLDAGERQLRRRHGAAPAAAACRWREVAGDGGHRRPRTRSSSATWPRQYQQSTFGAHFVEVAVDAYTARSARAPHAGRVRVGPHPEPEDGAQPGDRRA